ncbi:hypothetical protein [Luteibacter sp. 22Crub2.1]|nr:hypothetical protein [Luteibacter sp. 22Crub2.1]
MATTRDEQHVKLVLSDPVDPGTESYGLAIHAARAVSAQPGASDTFR